MEHKKLNKSENKSAQAFCRMQKTKYFKLRTEALSLLTNKLEVLSHKSEKELTKKDLLQVIELNFQYMKLHSLYVYYRDSLTRLIYEFDNADK